MTTRPPIAAIDSMALVWGIRRVGDRHQCARAKWLFKLLDEQKAQIILPSVALAEFLTPIAPSKHSETTAQLSARFLIKPFDTRCAAIAAQLFLGGKSGREMGRKDARKCLRADCLVVATAHCHGATVFYSGDKDCRNLAATLESWTVKDLPDSAPSLFD